MKRALALVLSAGLLAGCSQGGSEVTYEIEGTPTPTPTPSAPTSAAAPSSSPSATESTEAVTTKPPKVLGTIATGLAAPWGLDFLPDGDAIVTERDTRRVLRIGGERPHRVTELGTIDAAAPQGEAGLLGVAVSPTFDEDRFVFLYVSTAEDNRVVRATLRGNRLGTPEPILTGIPNGFRHDGGRLEFGPNGYLYVTTGEIGEPDRAQDREDLAGKILRITPDGDPAPGNPFDSPVWSWGHRNVQGLAFVDDQLWASEFGDQTFDELNRIRAGDNYGWPEVEGEGGTDQGFTDPQVTWGTDEASPSGLAYAGGHLWLAALKGERLWRVDLEDGEATNPTPYFVGDYGRMRTVVTAPDGRLWLTTSNRDGRIDPREGDDRILVIRP
ncbi:PQQ-dependent sugar dehydrogenase [Nocardioides lianchengensis]|uniref:Glucose/arabinose dehydrogenase, beta-propeller fold n=1 Tax=Nocardioides lianchengensis TaxID=1045774 RepID=A0A1G6NSY8_9ACTN|nr:PQQ-dependent sugar dehydrogenase [Nocardioides lianchengensis]NYG10872.1 glucose/arabinose dehydrogenase [Nocardioides lianchengensis]SDC70731.1 Glucose/arabinose dehydrogenase, beta-propeller fold [Nocardioides lianchengensis]